MALQCQGIRLKKVWCQLRVNLIKFYYKIKLNLKRAWFRIRRNQIKALRVNKWRNRNVTNSILLNSNLLEFRL